MKVSGSQHIAAPIERVFAAVSDIARFPEVVPAVVDIEFVTEQRAGVGTRFDEIRSVKGFRSSTRLEVIESVPDACFVVSTTAFGSEWHTRFEVAPAGEHARLEMSMIAHTRGVVGRAFNRLIRRTMEKAVAEYLQHAKAYCESR